MRPLLASAALILGQAAPGAAAPGLPDRPTKWEYAELTYRVTVARPGGPGAAGPQAPALTPTVTVHWVTGEGEIEVKGWDELAEKLKVTGFKKDGSASLQKIQVLNFLGSQGWELMEQAGPTSAAARAAGAVGASGTWMFKRRVP